MNIALFSDSYLPTKSGVVTVVIQLRKILEEMGHHVVIVTVSSNDKDYEEEPDPNIMRVMSILSPLGEGQYITERLLPNFFRKTISRLYIPIQNSFWDRWPL